MSGDRISDEAILAARVAFDGAYNSDGVSWANAMRSAIAAALPLLEGGKGEPVAWMVRNTDTGELHWDVEACVFADAGSANEMAECLNDGDPPIWEAFPLYTAPQPAAQQPVIYPYYTIDKPAEDGGVLEPSSECWRKAIEESFLVRQFRPSLYWIEQRAKELAAAPAPEAT